MYYPWLSADYQQIMHGYLRGQGHHALLLRTLPGLGLDALARALAVRLLCMQPMGEQPCGHCHSCQLMAAGNHPDFYQLEPESGKSQIGVERVRQVCEKLYTHAQQGGAKVIWMPDAGRLNEASANALLKTLEEPPANTFFILGLDESASLLPTIASRCQRWRLTVPNELQALGWMQQQPQASGFNHAQALQALRLSRGAPLAALDLLAGNDMQRRTDVLQGLLLFLQTADVPTFIAQLVKENPAENLSWIISLLLETSALALGSQTVRINQDMQPVMEQLLQRIDVVTLQHWLQALTALRHELLTSGSLNSELLLTTLWLRLSSDI
ncbi:DNA polymerase III subunit delta' [Plesiomonas shigelloides]|uniref:DNA polymerase III subunit delta' n=1 Tax=Plesiomonas shigelloides TaxID=703 RepID=UPI0015B45509|nr:DNA polymerase III subunit delta' [Plesiomonas shigelloides]